MKQAILSKSSQEEMIGFVLIIVLVAVIALVFLSFNIRTIQAEKDSEIESFLYSSLLYTTSCEKPGGIAYDLNGLIKACYNNEFCIEGESCEVLENTLKDLIEKSWNIGENSVEKAHILKVYQGDNILIDLTEGKETKTKKGAEIPIYVEGNNIYIKMEVFY